MPVLTARATLAATFSGLCAKPPSKSALTGRSTAPHSAVRCSQTSSSVTRLSAFPIDHAKPALVEAIALKPRCCSAFALPTSQGFGSTKQPASCSLRNVARLSVVAGMTPPCLRWTMRRYRRHAARASARREWRGCPSVLAHDRSCRSRGLRRQCGADSPGRFSPGLWPGLCDAAAHCAMPQAPLHRGKTTAQDLALLGQALEAFNRNKSVDGFQDGPQLGRKIEVLLPVLGLRPDFEDYSYHLRLPCACEMAYNVTLRKNVRSSARMNLFSSAKSKLAKPSASARSWAR